MYRIRPYLIQKIDEGIVVQNGISTTVITDNDLIHFLEYIEETNMLEVNRTFIVDNFDDKADKIIEFLVKNNIIESVAEVKLEYDTIRVITNSEEFMRTIVFCKNDFEHRLVLYDIIELDKLLSETFDNDMVLLYLNPFNLKKYTEICDAFIKKNVIIRTSFFYNHSIYVSNLYKKEWKNPCPKCFFFELETQLRAEPDSTGMNFQILIDLLYKKNPRFEVSYPLKYVDMIFILKILLNQAKESLNDVASKVYQYNIVTKKMSEDFAYHWEMCDCYE